MSPHHHPHALDATQDPADERLTSLEIKISYLEDQVDALNQTVYRQANQIDVLIHELRALKAQQAAGGTVVRSLRDELPPHY
ncbi:SlyX family protein [Ideonella livida]|uniref:SlyX family protein n=1 Tax=Ideonella livida TaxID=2707176 RepID=A0A7C9PFB0_9BURK|nr:SlyX family protein [Ideonella livida]NDY90476.1 SlyX family protein [Ideonella livida]